MKEVRKEVGKARQEENYEKIDAVRQPYKVLYSVYCTSTISTHLALYCICIWAEPEGFNEGSGKVSTYIPTRVIIQILSISKKNPAYGRHRVSQPMRIVALRFFPCCH